MKANLTDITLVIDRSGSMASVRDDAEGGVNEFIKQQAQEPGEALLTLVQFATEYEFLHKGVAIGQVPEYKLHPRGMTALLDAVGRAINEAGERLSAMDEAERPGLVIFVVMTDGHENSCREFSRSQIKEMIERQRRDYNWQFTFLGANQDAFAEAGAMGMDAAGAANYTNDKVKAAYGATMSKVARMRRQSREGQMVDNAFTAQERDEMC